MLAFTLAYHMGISKYFLLYPVILLVQDVFMLGFGFILSAITVYMRDIQHFIGVVLQLLMYMTPVFYTTDSIPENFIWIFKINPMAYIIDGYRDIMYYQRMPNMKVLGLIFFGGIVLSIIGYFIFQKLQRRFAEEL